MTIRLVKILCNEKNEDWDEINTNDVEESESETKKDDFF